MATRHRAWTPKCWRRGSPTSPGKARRQYNAQIAMGSHVTSAKIRHRRTIPSPRARNEPDRPLKSKPGIMPNQGECQFVSARVSVAHICSLPSRAGNAGTIRVAPSQKRDIEPKQPVSFRQWSTIRRWQGGQQYQIVSSEATLTIPDPLAGTHRWRETAQMKQEGEVDVRSAGVRVRKNVSNSEMLIGAPVVSLKTPSRVVG